MSTNRQILPSGVRLITEHVPWANSATICLCSLGGSSDEDKTSIGLTHLLEHMLFKRVGERGPAALAREMDFLGQEVSAFTDFDSLCLHVHVSRDKVGRALDFMIELLRDSEFTEADLANEKGVIRQEIIDGTDDPNEAVYLSFMNNFWPDSPLGWHVYGNQQTLDRFTCADLEERRKELLKPERLIVCVVGNFDEDVVKKAVDFPASESASYKTTEPGEKQFGLYFAPKPVNQSYFIMGCEFPGVCDEEFELGGIVNLIFGEGMSSRLFQSLREDNGLAYDVSSEIDSYARTSAFLVSLQTEPANFSRAFSLVAGEIKKLAEEGLTQEEFDRALSLRISSLELDKDSLSRRMWRLLEHEVYFKSLFSEEKVFEKYRSYSLDKVNQFVRKWLVNNKYVLVLGGATDDAKIDDGRALANLL